jgi:hypothetical protein
MLVERISVVRLPVHFIDARFDSNPFIVLVVYISMADDVKALGRSMTDQSYTEANFQT